MFFRNYDSSTEFSAYCSTPPYNQSTSLHYSHNQLANLKYPNKKADHFLKIFILIIWFKCFRKSPHLMEIIYFLFILTSRVVMTKSQPKFR